MSDYYQKLADKVNQRFAAMGVTTKVEFGELTAEVPHGKLISVCTALRDEAEFAFEIAIDVCGVDYSAYGHGNLENKEVSLASPSAGKQANTRQWDKPRFAAVYHLLSVKNNHRMRVRAFAPDDDLPRLPSVVSIWNGVNWFEREAFDLYGIVFEGHPDLRRILTDYGFIGHPFRKDFPLIGNVEMRYDPEKQRVVYQPVSIEHRDMIPRIIREDHRYDDPDAAGESHRA